MSRTRKNQAVNMNIDEIESADRRRERAHEQAGLDALHRARHRTGAALDLHRSRQRAALVVVDWNDSAECRTNDFFSC